MAESRRHHRPALPGSARLETLQAADDPAARSEAADRCATVLVRGTSDGRSGRADGSLDEAVVARVVALADAEGLDTIAELWAGSPADSLAGSLWRLYLLRSWVYADPAAAAREFDAGRRYTPVDEVIAGVVDPPGPGEVRELVDLVLRGVVSGDFADTLYRAAAFARVAAAGRAQMTSGSDADDHASDLSAARLLTMAQQLEASAALEAGGNLF